MIRKAVIVVLTMASVGSGALWIWSHLQSDVVHRFDDNDVVALRKLGESKH